MARATRCPKCGLMQMGVGAQCKKCGAPLEGRAVSPAPAAPVPVKASAPGNVNPYAPPSVSFGGPAGSQASEGVWQDGKLVVVSLYADLPDRCVKCNLPAGGYRVKRKLTWHPSGWYALILIGVIVYAIVATIIQKKMTVHVGLCETHRKRRLWLIGLGLGLPLLGGLGCTATLGSDSAIGIGAVGFLAGIVLLIIGTNLLAAESIDDRFGRIRGAHHSFLASLPPFHR